MKKPRQPIGFFFSSFLLPWFALFADGADAAVSGATVASPAQSSSSRDGVGDFDFQRGEWRVRHRVKRQEAWIEFGGTCRNRALIDGSANVEEHTFMRSTGITYGIALRAYDAKTGQWTIWWVDSRDPHAPLDPPVKGHFENGVGTFYSDYMADGKPMRLRYIWSHISAHSAQWEQAISSDQGKTWDTNWKMEFERTTP
jgi:hypothetical protein